MEKSRNYVVFGVLALVVSLVAVSLAYAGFTQTLTINGAATVKAAKWHVFLNNIANKTTTGTAVWVSEPTIASGAILAEYSATLKTPGDSVSFEFDTVNDGNWAAVLRTIQLGTVACTVDGQKLAADGSVEEAQFDCSEALTYELYDGATKVVDLASPTRSNYTAGNLAAKTGTHTYKLVLTYVDKANNTIMPKADATVTIGSTTFDYEQDASAYVD